jgi:hypothetical protein
MWSLRAVLPGFLLLLILREQFGEFAQAVSIRKFGRKCWLLLLLLLLVVVVLVM